MNETAVASDEATSEGIAREGIPGREPRPPILRARFTKARVVYLQRFTMEQVRSLLFCSPAFMKGGCVRVRGVHAFLLCFSWRDECACFFW